MATLDNIQSTGEIRQEMALVNEENDDVSIPDDGALIEYFRISPDILPFNASLAGDQSVGFFSIDRCTQTEVTEIVKLKELTNVIHNLVKDVSLMKRDIDFARNVMEANFENKLQMKSIELYTRVNEKVENLEKSHTERVATVRRAFKTQLSDAIARMHTYYTQDLDSKLIKEKKHKEKFGVKQEAKIREMQNKLQHNENVIAMLTQQLAHYQKDDEDENRPLTEFESESEADLPKPEEPQHEEEEEEDQRPRSRTQSSLLEISNLKQEIQNLHHNIKQLDKDIETKVDENTKLLQEINILKSDLRECQHVISQMKEETNQLVNNKQQDKAYSEKLLEEQRLEFDKEIENRIAQTKTIMISDFNLQLKSLREDEQKEMKKINEEKKRLEMALIDEKSKSGQSNSDTYLLAKSRRNEQILRAQITRLKNEMEKVHKTWEKKFAILQQSLHALKDESYVRQTMQRQAAQLHQASISYAYDAPLAIAPTSTQKKRLPDIQSKNPKENNKNADYLSYTVSAASHIASMNMDENQVMSDAEGDLPTDFIPLPSPPHSELQKEETHSPVFHQKDDSFAVTENSSRQSSHIIVLPSVTAI